MDEELELLEAEPEEEELEEGDEPEADDGDEDEIIDPDADEPDEPVEDDPPPAVEGKKQEVKKESDINEQALSSLLDQREKQFRADYEAKNGFEPLEDTVFTFRYMEERSIRAEVAAEVERGKQQLEAIRANVSQYEQEFVRAGAPKSAAAHFVKIAEEYGGNIMANPKAVADAKAMAIGRALLAEGGVRQKKVLPKGESPSAKPTGYTNAERSAMQEMKASGVPITKKALKEWMAYGA